jgi:DNA-binding transcriptional LysR family regulator
VGVLRAYSGAYPQVALRLVEDGNDELIARLRAGELEVVLVATDPPPLPRLKPINGLRDMALWLEPLCAAVPDTVEAEGLGWDDFAGKRLLSRPKDDWRRFTEYVSRLGGPVLSFAEQDVGMSSLLGLVAAGAGWSILPSCAAGLATAGVKIVPIVSAGASLQVEALWRPQTDNPRSPASWRYSVRCTGPSHLGSLPTQLTENAIRCHEAR